MFVFHTSLASSLRVYIVHGEHSLATKTRRDTVSLNQKNIHTFTFHNPRSHIPAVLMLYDASIFHAAKPPCKCHGYNYKRWFTSFPSSCRSSSISRKCTYAIWKGLKTISGCDGFRESPIRTGIARMLRSRKEEEKDESLLARLYRRFLRKAEAPRSAHERK